MEACDLGYCLIVADQSNNGARGRDRTADTAIFSRMLYQLSYPGIGPDYHREGGFLVIVVGAVQPGFIV